MTEKITENVYTFPITLPQSPLKWLNCYVIKKTAGGRNLLIDTGFNRTECRETLLAGMAELELDPAETDVFLTHFHADHSGNAGTLERMGCHIIMSRTDNDHMHLYAREEIRDQMLREGMPPALLDEVFGRNPAAIYISEPFCPETVEDGAELSYGGYRLRCVATPGHTPGHMCLYDAAKRIIFLGDHVLFDITPNICSTGREPDVLGTYLDSLRRIMNYGVDFCLPGHRSAGTATLRQRVDALMDHHDARLEEAERIVRGTPGLNAYEIAGEMRWRIRAKNWEEFPPGQKVFAIGEALAHLDRLVVQGRIAREPDAAGIVRYHGV